MKTYKREHAVDGAYMFCPKSENGSATNQKYRGTVRCGKSQQYDVYVCSCNGKRHINRMIVGNFHKDRKLPRDHGCAKPGYSIFGQKLQHRS